MKKHKVIAIILIVVAIAFGAGYTFFALRTKTVDTIEIVFGESINSYNPYTQVLSNDRVLRLIYEPLVRLDESLNIEPRLVSSYGRLDDTTWEFTLLPDIVFHNGEPLTSQTVKASFDSMQDQQAVQQIISSIDSIQVTDDLTFTISLKYIDPLILNKLAILPITPMQSLDQLESSPNGTGPYKLKSKGDREITLAKNEAYYGDEPQYNEVKISMIPDRLSRIEHAIETENVALMYPYPAAEMDRIDQTNLEISRGSNLTVNFIAFNFRNEKLNDKALRELFLKSLSDEELNSLTDELGKPTAQFISEGVLGYDPTASTEKLDRPELQNLVKSTQNVGFKFKVALPEGLEIFKNFLLTSWTRIGMQPEIDLVDEFLLTSKQVRDNYDLIFLGWKSDYADAGQFLNNFVLPNAALNIGQYKNDLAARLTNEAQSELDLETRKLKVEQAMEIITFTDPIGIPLFESEILYGVDKRYTYIPRADGLIDIEQLKLK